jgi:hypothetical protein
MKALRPDEDRLSPSILFMLINGTGNAYWVMANATPAR